MDDVTYERNKTGVKDYSNAEFKIISAQAEEAQKVLNQWRHMYAIYVTSNVLYLLVFNPNQSRISKKVVTFLLWALGVHLCKNDIDSPATRPECWGNTCHGVCHRIPS